jgi:hypothetical protein
MPVQGLTITVTNIATLLAGSGTHGLIRSVVRNRGIASIYVGSSSASTGSYQLTTDAPPLETVLNPWDSLYGISSGGNVVVDVLRTGETT